MVSISTATAPPVLAARSEAEQIDSLIAQLTRNHNVDPATVRVAKAPLRICPLGAHIDHQLGRVTGITINQALLLAFAPSTNGAVHIESANFNTPVSFNLGNVPPYKPRDWGNYIRGAVLALQQQGHQLEHGLVGVIGGEMPIGGLSSSAAVTIAYLLALAAVNQLNVPPEDNVGLVRYTENKYIGLKNGILDQSVILFSEHNHLTLIDCETFDISQVPTNLNPNDFEVLVVYSGVTHVLVGTDYNSRVAECQAATRELLTLAKQPIPDNPRLRHVSPDIFATEGHRLPENLQRRATHYFGEMQRVSDGVSA